MRASGDQVAHEVKHWRQFKSWLFKNHFISRKCDSGLIYINTYELMNY